jgi:hypothetical protein
LLWLYPKRRVLKHTSKLSQKIKDNIDEVRATLPSVQANVAAVQAVQQRQWDAQRRQQHEALMQWLSPTDFPKQHHDIISRKEEGTGQWFIDLPGFKNWLHGLSKTLFCSGMPGAGKTMMAAIAINYLCTTAPSNDIGIAYLFCNYKSQAEQSALNLLLALLKQLVDSHANFADSVEEMYNRHERRKTRPSVDEVIKALRNACSKYTTSYIIVDALDECADENGDRGRLITVLRELQMEGDVRLLFTSRSIPEIAQKFELDLMLEVRATREDVEKFVASHVSSRYDAQLRTEIVNTIVEAVDGMYVYPTDHITIPLTC